MTAASEAQHPSQAGVERALLWGSIAVALAAGIPLLVSQLGGRSAPERAAHAFPSVSAAGLVERSGVRVARVAVSGAGGLIDLRYQVVDSQKAAAVHDPSTPPLLIDERSGAALGRMLMGHIHTNPPKVGLTYYLIFENSGAIVRPGSRVTVQLGDARLPHVTVR